MRFGNLDGRLVLTDGAVAVDVATASGGRFGSDPSAALERWDEFLAWGRGADLSAGQPVDADRLGPPVSRPRQIFGLALNYRPHASEAGFEPPPMPLVFAKFPTCITGPRGVIALPPGNVDWELELVVVVARDAYRVSASDGWSAIAGVTVGQDLSERRLQLSGAPPQFSLGKSYPGFGPIGPTVVTCDELDDPDDLELSCTLNGEVVQSGRTSEMIFSVAEQVAFITAVCPVFGGDLIFTGTPAGVGNRRTPPRFLGAGDELVSRIGGVGEMRHRFVAASG